MLKELCISTTNLTEEDIKKLEDIQTHLELFAALVKGDVFIDCITENKDEAIVVAEAKPLNCKSLYRDSVVGKIALRKNEPAVLRTLEIGLETMDFKATTQENIVVRQNTVPIKNKNGNVIGVLIVEKDITEHISQSRNMEILAETTEKLSETLMNMEETSDQDKNVAYNLINDGVLVINEKGICVYANYKAEELYKSIGYKDEIVGMCFDNLVLSDLNFNGIIKEKNCVVLEANVGKLVLQIKYAVVKKLGKVCSVVVLIKDLTYIKEKEKELVLKAVAIREIHHRVKNNLQTIASILRLQARRINDIEAKKAFEESINRILSIAATHEILSQNGIDDVDIKIIISKIKDNVCRSYMQVNKNIEINLQGNGFVVNSDRATSIAIVVNELIENSIKHAFISKKAGKIDIDINRGKVYSSISITDNGNGFDTDKVKKESLGLNIVKSIVSDKLNGNINIESSENGTKTVFYFENQ